MPILGPSGAAVGVDIVPPRMAQTPWGDSSQLRNRTLPPGRQTSAAEAAQNHRERLFGAMVALTAEKGYEETTVADLVNLSGVSRSAFYRQFADKQACFLAAIEAIVDPALEGVSEALAPGGETPTDGERARQAFEGLLEQIVEQPAAAAMCFVEVYAGGSEAIALLDRATDSLEQGTRRVLDGMGREAMPAEIVRALIGGVQKVIHKRLYRGTPEELPGLAQELWDWALLYPPPPGPLRGPRRRALHPLPFEERQAASHPSERLLRALAAVVSEKGYPETTITDIIERAGTSYRAFYERFESKEDAVVAALDVGSLQMLATALPAFRRAKDWVHAVQGTQEAMFLYGVQEPEYARLGAVEMYAAGKRALEQRETVTEQMEGLLEAGYEVAPDVPPIAAEAIGGALYALFYDHVKQKGPERLAELVPWTVYVTLSPFIGGEEAYTVATGGGGDSN
jgi:AcrR family transcriptional regulator